MRYCIISSRLTIAMLLVVIKGAVAQVDITKYASDDLFSVKPVITQEYLETTQKEKESEISSLVEAEIAQAMDFWAHGQYDDALDLFSQLAEEYNEGIFYYYMGALSYERARYDDAAGYLHEALGKEPLLLEATYMLGLVALAEDDTRTAKIHFKKLTDVPLYEAFGENGLALMAWNAGDYSGAAMKFKKCIKLDSAFLEAYPLLVSYYMALGRYQSARKVIEKALRTDPKWQKGLIIRGMVSILQDQNTNQFEQDINTLIKLDPNNYHYYSIRGYLQAELGQYHEAVKTFHTALNLAVDSIRAGEFKFSSKMKRDEPMQRALNYYFEHYGMNPAVRMHLDRGICELLQDNRKKGLAYLDSANRIEEHAMIYMFIGSANKTVWGKTEEMVHAFTKSIELDSLNWRAFSYRAEGYCDLKEDKKAYRDYSRVISLKPRLKEGYKNRGNILLAHGQYQLAYRDFSVAVAIDDSDYDIFFNRAVASINMGAYEQSITDLRHILTHKPHDGEAYYLLKVSYQHQGDTLKSIQYLDSASQYVKYNGAYHQELRDLAMRYSREDLCMAAHDRLVKYDSYNYRHRLNRAKYLYKAGNYNKAITDLEKYVEKKPDCGEGYFYLASALQKQGNAKSSEKYFRKADRLGYTYAQ